MAKMFGEYLKQLRRDRHMTLRDVEKKAKISNAYLSQVESGERNMPTVKILSRLASAYGISLSDLLKATMAEMWEEGKNIKNKIQGEIPAPDTEFICRGYENLSEENKQALKKFLSSLTRDEKEKR